MVLIKFIVTIVVFELLLLTTTSYLHFLVLRKTTVMYLFEVVQDRQKVHGTKPATMQFAAGPRLLAIEFTTITH